MPLLPKALAGVDTPCLAGTSAQHIQGEPSQISLGYFKPTKDAGPLPLSHKYLHSHARPGLVTNPPEETGSQRRVEGVTGVTGVTAGREHRGKGAQGLPMTRSSVGKLRLKTSKVMGLHVHYTPKFLTGNHRGVWNFGQQPVNLLKSCTKSPLWRNMHSLEGKATAFITFPSQKSQCTVTSSLLRAQVPPLPGTLQFTPQELQPILC